MADGAQSLQACGGLQKCVEAECTLLGAAASTKRCMCRLGNQPLRGFATSMFRTKLDFTEESAREPPAQPRTPKPLTLRRYGRTYKQKGLPHLNVHEHLNRTSCKLSRRTSMLHWVAQNHYSRHTRVGNITLLVGPSLPLNPGSVMLVDPIVGCSMTMMIRVLLFWREFGREFRSASIFTCVF